MEKNVNELLSKYGDATSANAWWFEKLAMIEGDEFKWEQLLTRVAACATGDDIDAVARIQNISTFTNAMIMILERSNAGIKLLPFYIL